MMMKGNMMDYSYVFFLGAGHSGSTIVSAILQSHPNTSISEEWSIVGKVLSGDLTVKEARSKMLNPSRGVRRTAILDSMGRLDSQKEEIKFLGDKSPWNVVSSWHRSKKIDIYKPLEDKLGGKVKIVITMRDPYLHLPGYFTSKKALRTTGVFELHRRYTRHLSKVYEAAAFAFDHVDCTVISNEDLIESPSENIHKLLDFLELPCATDWCRQVKSAIYSKPDKKVYDFSIDHRGRSLTDHVEDRIIAKFAPMKRYSRR
jgi:hypothetical protein